MYLRSCGDGDIVSASPSSQSRFTAPPTTYIATRGCLPTVRTYVPTVDTGKNHVTQVVLRGGTENAHLRATVAQPCELVPKCRCCCRCDGTVLCVVSYCSHGSSLLVGQDKPKAHLGQYRAAATRGASLGWGTECQTIASIEALSADPAPAPKRPPSIDRVPCSRIFGCWGPGITREVGSTVRPLALSLYGHYGDVRSNCLTLEHLTLLCRDRQDIVTLAARVRPFPLPDNAPSLPGRTGTEPRSRDGTVETRRPLSCAAALRSRRGPPPKTPQQHGEHGNAPIEQ